MSEHPSSQAYARYHPAVQQWIYNQGWDRLRDVQERAAALISAGQRDVIIASATASGKTEAALLPICSALARRQEQGFGSGVAALSVSPLKALINDQYERLAGLADPLGLRVHRWHGDAPASGKARVLRAPEGLLLITPESLEALFVRHGDRVSRIFSGLRYVVIDELHSFIGTERGAQLQALLHRVEEAIGRRVPRIALSATLGDFSAAADFLRPRGGAEVAVVSSTEPGGEIRLQVRGYVHPATQPEPGQEPADRAAIADHLFRTLGRTDNLVFANSRAAVEVYADMLTQRAARAQVPARFLAHHGSLSKEVREHVEERLKDPGTPVTAICTSTLELGIDVGSVDSVAQIGAPPTVSGLRQRLGRSGRRPGQPAVLRTYVTEPELSSGIAPADTLRPELFQTVAMTELLISAWYEPPDDTGLHLSALIQQILSISARHGGARAGRLFTTLCETGPFRRVDRATFARLLRDMGRRQLLEQSADGALLPGREGERLLGHYSFYASFHTSLDYRLVADGYTLGSLPVDRPILPGALLIFSGARWRVISVDTAQRVIELTAAEAGKPPVFPGAGGEIADQVRRRMFQLYRSGDIPGYLDAPARTLLAEGRAAFHAYGHSTRRIFAQDSDTLLFPWRGDRIMNTLAAVLGMRGLAVSQDGLAITVGGCTPDRLLEVITSLAAGPPPKSVTIAAAVRAKQHDKYDRYLSEELLNLGYAGRALDVSGAWACLTELVSGGGGPR
ncbi:DEAD/DEAH box helicase [Paractinoplanes hotanensis]|uniref:DEAD/DEAH box helicase n=1 Tax=Paractinoplanes hotanensis TaxID=2906497 RepID=A0ABT0YFT1_9ACTN|nr:DEAD/DEAH box helicase [Actinoplanes hotanensis]MCM4084615.1 DEAD/DEAH box helicase [Actinoplanes hotanensis]